MIENENAAQAAEEEISVEIVEDPPEGQEAGSANEGDELERYTKSVSKRINKLNQKTKQAEDRAEYLEQLAMQKDQELNAYRQHSVVQQNTVLQKEEEALVSKESQIDDIYKKAIQSGDADLISKADTLKNDIAIQKEKLPRPNRRIISLTRLSNHNSKFSKKRSSQQTKLCLGTIRISGTETLRTKKICKQPSLLILRISTL